MSGAVLYHRVSRIDQDPTLARHELRAAAAARGLEVALDVEETGGGARNDRPALRRVLDAARRRQIDAVLVWKLDRFGRSALDLLANVRALEDAGCRFIAVTQGIDIRPGGDPMSRLQLTMLAAVAEFERERIIERTHLGLDKARREGKRLGRPRSSDAPDEATVAALLARGVSWSQIARTLLAEAGVQTHDAAMLKRTLKAAQRAAERAIAQGLIVASPPDGLKRRKWTLPENGGSKMPPASVEREARRG